jgi:hypothetical protein
MRLSNFVLATRTAFLAGAIFLACPAVVTAAEQAKPSSESAAPTSQALAEWRKHMTATPPRGGSCFTAKYPDPTWRPTECVRSPPISLTVGGGTDINAFQGGALITQATGSFMIVARRNARIGKRNRLADPRIKRFYTSAQYAKI